MQSLGERLQAKSQFIRKVIPDLYPLRVLKEERDVVIRRAEEAEAAARETVRADISRVQEENRKLREEVLDLRGGMRGKYSHPTAAFSCS